MNPLRRKPFLAWPGWDHLKFTWLMTLLVWVWFALIYVGSDWVTAHRSLRVRIHLDAELRIPLVPSFTLVYMTVYALFLAVPFILRTRKEVVTLAKALSTAILFAGICFLLLPAQLAFAPPADFELGAWKVLFDFADRLNLDYNLLPSLHVALSVICIELFSVHAGCGGRFLLRAWGVLIAGSTVLTHQHHLLDAVTGYLLAFGAMKFVDRKDH